ncbi:MAG: arylsulfotransferase family protein [Bacteriovoracaceae bacterium]
MNFVSKIFFVFFFVSFQVQAQGDKSSLVLDKGVKLVNIDKSFIEVQGRDVFFYEYKLNQLPQIEFSTEFPGTDCRLGKKIVCRSNAVVSFNEIEKNNSTLVLSYKKGRESIEFKFHRLPKNFPAMLIKGKSHLNQDFVFSWVPQKVDPQEMSEFSYLFIFSPEGKLKYFRYLPFIAIDFRPHVLGKRIYFSYLKSSAYYPFVTIEGKRELFDERMVFIKEFPELLDFHDFHLFDKDWYMGMTYTISQNKLGRKYLQQSIVEIKNGKKVFEWTIDDYMKLNPFPDWKLYSLFRGQTVVQQFHLNHIQVLGEYLLVSLGFESIVMLHKKTKKISWVLGGGSDQFGAVGELGTTLHHTPNLDLKTSVLTVFDNGMNKQLSRIIQYGLDLKNKKIKKFSLMNIPSVYASMMGSVNQQNNIYTIGFGTRDKGEVDILEVENNKPNISFYFKYPKSGIYQVYRATTIF